MSSLSPSVPTTFRGTSPAGGPPLDPRPDPEHDARVVQAIARAYAEIPFARSQAGAPIDPDMSLSDVLTLPLRSSLRRMHAQPSTSCGSRPRST